MFNDFFARLRHGRPVVIVSGLPRSGTSLLMSMLAAGGLDLLTDGARAADADNPRGYFELERVKQLEHDPDKAWVREARGRGLKVISHLLRELPAGNAYRVLFTVRDLTEVVQSQNTMLQRRGEPNPVDDAKAIQLYDQHLRNVRVLVRTRPNMRLLELPYRDTLARPAVAAARINRFLGGRLDEAAMAAVVDPALYRQRAPAP